MRLGGWLLSLAVGFGLAASSASAATFEVTKRGDPSPGSCTPSDCSLREAVLRANASVGVADRIVLPSRRTYRLAIPGIEDGAAAGDLDLTNGRVKIVHPGKGRATVDANGLDRVVDVYARTALTKVNLTGGEADFGGGLRGSFSEIDLLGVAIRGNEATQCGGGIHTNQDVAISLFGSSVVGNRAGGNGGGMSVSCFGGNGEVNIIRSTISGNRSDVDSTGNGFGGGIYLQMDSDRQGVIRDSTIANNNAGPGATSSRGGGLYTDLGRVRITGTTISSNRTASPGGGINVDGTEPLVMQNSTVANNRSNSNGGGIYLSSGDVRMNAVTVARNFGNADGMLSEAGGGLYKSGLQPFRVRNSLIALNRIGGLMGAPPVDNDCSGEDPFISQGHNLLSTRFLCDGFGAPGDRVRANPKIARLARNGGPTKTVALKKGSPAIDEAQRSTTPGRDQRGRKRDRRPDIGAFER